MGYVFQFEDALHYDDWFTSEPGRTAAAIEQDLLARLWAPGAPQSVLEVGCGTGLFLEWFVRMGHQVTGLDPSPYMLNIARRLVPERVALDRGFAEELPYEDNAFDTVALITALEFVNDPHLALQEALRVARRQVLLGVLNKYSVSHVAALLETALAAFHLQPCTLLQCLSAPAHGHRGPHRRRSHSLADMPLFSGPLVALSPLPGTFPVAPSASFRSFRRDAD